MKNLYKKLSYLKSIRKTFNIDEFKQLNILTLYNSNIIELTRKYCSSNELSIEQILSITNKDDKIYTVLRENNDSLSIEIIIQKNIKGFFYTKPINSVLQFIKFPNEYLHIFEKEIEINFKEYCEDIYEKELVKLRNNKIKEIYDKLLNNEIK